MTVNDPQGQDSRMSKINRSKVTLGLGLADTYIYIEGAGNCNDWLIAIRSLIQPWGFLARDSVQPLPFLEQTVA